MFTSKLRFIRQVAGYEGGPLSPAAPKPVNQSARVRPPAARDRRRLRTPPATTASGGPPVQCYHNVAPRPRLDPGGGGGGCRAGPEHHDGSVGCYHKRAATFAGPPKRRKNCETQTPYSPARHDSAEDFCRTVHSHGLDVHSRVLCCSMTGVCGADPTAPEALLVLIAT